MSIFPFYTNLHAYSAHPERELWLVHWMDAAAVTASKEFEAIDRWEVRHALFGVRFDDFDVERFLSRIDQQHMLFDGHCTPWDGSDRLTRLVEGGVLVAVRRARQQETSTGDRTIQIERSTVREIERLQRTTRLFPGRQCVVVSGADYRRVRNRERYQVVGYHEAKGLLASAASHATLPAGASQVLERAITLLAPNWRPPQQPAGIVLLREIQRVEAIRKPEAPITPSQMRAMLKPPTEMQLEIVVQGLDGKPLKDVLYVVESPDGTSYDGELGPSGKMNITSTEQGSASVSLSFADPSA